MPVLIFKRLHMPEINPSRKTPALIFLIFIKNAALNPPAQKKTLFINARGSGLNQKRFLEFMNFTADGYFKDNDALRKPDFFMRFFRFQPLVI